MISCNDLPARTEVKKTTFVFCKLFHTQSLLVSLVSVYLVSFQAYSTLCGDKCYVLLDLFCTVFLTIVFDFSMIFSQNSHPDTKSKSQNVQEDNAIHFDKIYCSKGVLHFSHKYRLPQVRSIEKRRKDWFQLLLLCKPESHLQRSPVWYMILGQIRKQNKHTTRC